jgi:GTP cyclohydrolase II
LLDRLDPRGYLFLGHSETMTGFNNRTRGVGPTVYVRTEPTPFNAAYLRAKKIRFGHDL